MRPWLSCDQIRHQEMKYTYIVCTMYYGHTSNLFFSSCSLEFREFAAYQRENGRTGARSTASARGIRGDERGFGFVFLVLGVWSRGSREE